jgi:hypothetical protein
MPKFDIIDDRFGEPLPIPPTTTVDTDERYDRTFFRAASEDRSKELLRGNSVFLLFNRLYECSFLAPRVDRNLGGTDRYVHPSDERTIDEHQPPRPKTSDIPPLPMGPMDTILAAPERTTIVTRDQFSIDALAFITSAIDTYPIYGFEPLFYENLFSSQFFF